METPTSKSLAREALQKLLSLEGERLLGLMKQWEAEYDCPVSEQMSLLNLTLKPSNHGKLTEWHVFMREFHQRPNPNPLRLAERNADAAKEFRTLPTIEKDRLKRKAQEMETETPTPSMADAKELRVKTINKYYGEVDRGVKALALCGVHSLVVLAGVNFTSCAFGSMVDDRRLQQFERDVIPFKQLVSKVDSFVCGQDFEGVVKTRVKVTDAQVVRRRFIRDQLQSLFRM
jgi:hypothetical protein